jgi:hypothetical protein
MRQLLIVPSIGCQEVACAQWPTVWNSKNPLQPLDFSNDPFSIHLSQSSLTEGNRVKYYGAVAVIRALPLLAPAPNYVSMGYPAFAQNTKGRATRRA